MVGACLCFKDSGPYLEEWLLFHHVQGIRRFYLYDNDSSDGWRDVVDPWIKAGLVSVRHFPGAAVQGVVYDDCILRARGEVEWLAFIDDDEFLFAVDGQAISSALQPFQAHAGVAVSWVLFGSGGIEAQTDDWVLKRFTRSAGGPDAHVKCVVRPDRVERSRVIGHAVESHSGYSIVDENHRPLSEPLNPFPSTNKLRINHYVTKSWEEWRFRRSRPQANTGAPTPHSEADWRTWDRAWSAHEDIAAQRFLGPMIAQQRNLHLLGG